MDAFQGYGFNKGHATSYGVLAVRAAYLKCNYPQQFFTALLDVYPDKSQYITAARSAGFKFLPPDINESGGGYTPGRGKNEIRIGFSSIEGIAGASINQIIAGQPFASLEDLRKRTTARVLNKARLENLAAIGALESLGIEGENSDLTDFKLLGFTLNTPHAFEGIKPRHTVKRDSGEWKHMGLYEGCDLTEGPVSVSKLFWIPPLNKKDIFKKKASAWAHVKTNLLTVIDVNGQPFELKANEDKVEKAEGIDFLATKCKGAVICVDGAIRAPFLYTGPLTFQLFNFTGAWIDDPQLFWNQSCGFKHDRDLQDRKDAIAFVTKKQRKTKSKTSYD